MTLFDSVFLPQGIALHISMERHVQDYTLWVLCVDDEAHRVLTRLALPNVRLLQLSRLETEDLLRLKPNRSRGEYCWTLTPFAPRFVFEADSNVVRVTYIDADIWFRKDPWPIFDEFESSGKAVLITDHAYAPENDQSAASGQYCVQFMIFDRCAGEEVRSWWETRCIEWCFAYHEDGKFGDQKYLDAWPKIFKTKVHVLKDLERTLAPWNATRFPYGNSIFYHFHGLRIISRRRVHIGSYYLPRVVIKQLYMPYILDLKKASEILCKNGCDLIIQMNSEKYWKKLYSFFKFLAKKVILRREISW